jgi:ubiquinone/menaquinone biosynthesis C-methylase UbiE
MQNNPFETLSDEYDNWYEDYPCVFESETEAIREALPYGNLRGIEVGLGTGRFSSALGIKEGVEPIFEMRKIALTRGIEVMDAVAERLPYKDLQFDFVLMVSCITYFNKLQPAFKEANRVLKKGGTLIVAFIEKNSIIGKEYENERDNNPFYKNAIFYSTEKVAEEIKNVGFNKLEFSQTLFEKIEDIKKFEPAKPGHDEGSFIVIKAIKK